jgi:DNA mismatch endonuclease, patch repair protein
MQATAIQDREFIMADVMTPEQRSRCMSRIRGKNTKPELILRQALWKRGFRYRIHFKLPGRPDIVFPKKRIAIFVDGCFWHGCPQHAVKPKSNTDFWSKKIQGNIDRDKRITEQLRNEGWTVLRFWEHEINKDLINVTKKVLSVLNASAQT